MYFVPGVTNPYGLPRKRGRKSDLAKFLARQGEFFLAARLVAEGKAGARRECSQSPAPGFAPPY